MSVSSLDSSPVPLDLEAKYQKVVSEYAKIRAQFGVLKKAVVDEQNHSSELKETLRVKDQSLRKAEQEIDSLTFRNQQLTKRITVLQDELEASQNMGKKGKGRGPSREIPNSLLAEELQKKITENAQLVSMLEEQSQKSQSENFELNQKTELLEHELNECRKKLVNFEENKLAKIESENKQLMVKLSAKDETIQKLNVEINMLRNRGNDRVIESETNEWKNEFITLLTAIKMEDLINLIIGLFQNFEMKFKSQIDGKALEEFLKCIQSNISDLTKFVNSYSNYCSNLSNSMDFLFGFEKIYECVNSHVLGLEELGTIFAKCLDEKISKIPKEIIESFKNQWTEFKSAIKMCLSLSKISPDADDCAIAFAEVFRSLRSTCDYYSSSMTDMYQFGEINLLGILGSEILSILSKIGAQSGSIYKKLIQNRKLIRNAIEYRPIKPKTRTESQSQDGQCCQQWKQKFEAMNAAHSKKIKDLEEQISCLSGAGTPRSSHSGNTVQSPVEGKEKLEISNTFGVLTGPSSLTGNREAHESELTKYFNSRANTLIADRQLAESKVTALKSECEALQNRLEHCMECREVLEESIKQSQDTVARLQEELATTTSNYELQLSSLSEHMANMNDKLASQQEEIEVLNYQLTEKGTKKGKSK